MTELELSLHLSARSGGDLAVPMTERRYFRRDKRLTFPHQGTTRSVVPDAGFLLSVAGEGSGRASQNVRPALLLHLVEMDNATMSLPRLSEKLTNYDLWCRSDAGRQYLTGLYRRYGAANPRANFRLLVVCHDKAKLHSEGDKRRELDVFTQALELPAAMRERVWITTVERLQAHQEADPPFSPPLWLRVRDARPWLRRYWAFVSQLPSGRGQKRYHNQRRFVAERLSELPMQPLFPARIT